MVGRVASTTSRSATLITREVVKADLGKPLNYVILYYMAL